MKTRPALLVAGEPTKSALDHGKKWATDAPLRKPMTDIRTALAAKQEGIHKGTLAPADGTALSSPIQHVT